MPDLKKREDNSADQLFERFRGGFRSAERGEQMNLGSCSQGPGRCGRAGKTAAGAFLVLMAVMAFGVLLMRSSLSAQESVTVSEVADSGPGAAVFAARLELERGNRSAGVSPVPEARKIRRAVRRGSRAGQRGARAPWIAIRTLKPPTFEQDDFFREFRETEKFTTRSLENNFDRPVFDEPPPYVNYDPDPMFRLEPPVETRFARAARRLAEKKFYVELRRSLKKEWQKNYENSSGLAYDKYQEQMLRINEIGREAHEYNLLVGDYYSSQLKGALFEEGYEGGERDIQLLGWGPFTIMDSGSMKVHFEKLFNAEDSLPRLGEPETKNPGREGFLVSDHYRVDTNLRLRFDLGQLIEEGDVVGMLESYGVSVSIDWLSKILGREMLTAELEAEVNREGDYAVALNFVLIGR